MKMMEILLAQLEREARTRKALERVPEGKNDWKPHEKSMPLGYLAALRASMPGWIASMIEKNHLDLGALRRLGGRAVGHRCHPEPRRRRRISKCDSLAF
jgi:hypothetical protein